MRQWLFFIGLLFAGLTLPAQDLPQLKSVRSCPFAHFERNHILYPGDSVAMDRFFQKLDSVVYLGKGNVSIMHIGGSHVQAGVLTERFRDNLLNIGDDLMGGQFFLFPFAAGGTNNPSHFIVGSTGKWQYCRNAVHKETDKRMGLAGAAITTTDKTASVSIVSRAKKPNRLSPEFKFNKVTLIGFSETHDTEPVVSYEGSNIKGAFDEYRSTYTFQLPDFTDSICICFETVPGEFTLTGVLLENGQSGISVHSVGVNGASVPSYLRCDDFERDLQLIRPDLIIFGIGINDASEKNFSKEGFKRNYGELIKIIQRVNPDCALLFMTNNDSYKRIKVKKKTRYEVNTNGLVVEEAFMELGKDYNAAVWDQFDIMGGLESMQEWQNAGLAQKDKVHFTKEGYILLGDLLYNALISRYIEHIQMSEKTK